MKVLVDSLESGPALEWAVHQATIDPSVFTNENGKLNNGVDPGLWPIEKLPLACYISRLGEAKNFSCAWNIKSKATEYGKFVSWISSSNSENQNNDDINHKDWPNYTPSKKSSLCFAIADNEPEAAAKCYVKYLSGPFVEIPDDISVHLPKRFHEACINGNLEKIKSLLEDGAPINERYAGLTPLHVAIKYGHFQLIKQLLGAGANPTIGDRFEAVDDEEGYSPLAYLLDPPTDSVGFSSDIEKYEAIKWLVNHGAAPKDCFRNDEILCQLLSDGVVQPNDETVGYILEKDRLQSARFLISQKIEISENLMRLAAPRIKSLFSERSIMSSFDAAPPVFPAPPSRPRRGLSL